MSTIKAGIKENLLFKDHNLQKITIGKELQKLFLTAI